MTPKRERLREPRAAYELWIVDASMSDDAPEGIYVFCPVDGDSVIVGINYVSDYPPGQLIGVMHDDGDDAAAAWADAHPDLRERAIREREDQ